MKAIYRSIILLILVSQASCSQEKLGPGGSTIEGTWRLYERGSSPGSGYYVETISPIPLQSLTFTKKGEVYRQGDLKGPFPFTSPYYRVVTLLGDLKIQFINSKKEESTDYLGLRIVGDTMRITPSCFEGCHYGFARVR
jgi:hypothetical protein